MPVRLARILLGIYASQVSTNSALKKVAAKYLRLKLQRTTVNNWKKRFAAGAEGNVAFRKCSRPNLLNDHLKKVKGIVMGTRLAGGVINRRQVMCIAKGVVKANNPHLLTEYGGSLELTNGWARNILKSFGWVKRKGITGKIAPSALLLQEETFSFQSHKLYTITTSQRG